jgi:hypothetical protein
MCHASDKGSKAREALTTYEVTTPSTRCVEDLSLREGSLRFLSTRSSYLYLLLVYGFQ